MAGVLAPKQSLDDNIDQMPYQNDSSSLDPVDCSSNNAKRRGQNHDFERGTGQIATMAPASNTGFITMHDVDIEPLLQSLTEDKVIQVEQETRDDNANAIACLETQSAIRVSRQRLKRIGEDAGPSLSVPGPEAGEGKSSQHNDNGSECEAIDDICTGICTDDCNYPREGNAETKYEVAGMASGNEEAAFDRQLDVELDALSASVAKLRRLAEAMGREVEMQNRTLSRMYSKDDQQPADKAMVGC